MNDAVDVEGELDAGFTSYWPPGETVDVTGDGDGSEKYEHWPQNIDPEALTEKQRKIVKVAFQNPAQPIAKVAEEAESSQQYAAATLKKEALEWYENVFKDKTTTNTKVEGKFECSGCGRVFDSKNGLGGHKSGCDGLQDDSETVAESGSPGEPEEPESGPDRDELDIVLETIKQTAVHRETIDAVEVIEGYL